MIPTKFLGIATIAGFGSILALSRFVPSALPWTLGGIAGIVSGSCIRNEQLRDVERTNREGRIVAATFQRLYESNKGLVTPHQLSVQADIQLDQAENFLGQLAVAQQAQTVSGPTGTGYQFQHPQNIIEGIHKEASEKLRHNTEQLVEQNQSLIKQLQVTSAAAANAAAHETTPEDLIQKVARARKVAKQAATQPGYEEYDNDEWGNLL